jgi:hypothetical protein
MQSITLIFAFLLSTTTLVGQDVMPMQVSKQEILNELDQLTPNKAIPGFYYLRSSRAGSKINLFSDGVRWAIVLEVLQSEYLSTYSFGNCLSLQRAEDYNESFPSNSVFFPLLKEAELSKLFNEDGFILKSADSITLRGEVFQIPQDLRVFKKEGIPIPKTLNPRKLLTLSALVRYFAKEYPTKFRASEQELRYFLPADLPKIFVIDKWHHKDFAMFPTADIHTFQPYGDKPSSYETWQLIADILVSRDVTRWKPTLKANSDWKYWAKQK